MKRNYYQQALINHQQAMKISANTYKRRINIPSNKWL